mmetsp:Transcript_136138/g.435462  ORF Transcript_136138/g.435462 Transcript_136138/m.435462 type:complete len:210 (-) Transcript_136138:1652-2281(-)
MHRTILLHLLHAQDRSATGPRRRMLAEELHAPAFAVAAAQLGLPHAGGGLRSHPGEDQLEFVHGRIRKHLQHQGCRAGVVHCDEPVAGSDLRAAAAARRGHGAIVLPHQTRRRHLAHQQAAELVPRGDQVQTDAAGLCTSILASSLELDREDAPHAREVVSQAIIEGLRQQKSWCPLAEDAAGPRLLIEVQDDGLRSRDGRAAAAAATA